MSRQRRIEYPGAIYHVMSRGKRRERIFRDEADRRLFRAALEGTVSIVRTDTCPVANGSQSSSALDILPVSVNPRYDANGNLIWDGVKSYQYDAANELSQITALNQWQTTFVYDGLGRRRIKREASYQPSSNTYVVTNEVHYVYDGMTVLQERDSNNNPLVTYTRGIDLSGRMQGAGGIGGLMARTDGTGTTFYHTDGSGNVTMLVNSAGAMQAKYLYDPYGNTLGMWGTLAVGNTYRFSSKEIEPKSGIYYYGYRYYEPNLQRWLNRDPIGENGGLNLYAYVGNNPINYYDPLGLEWQFTVGVGGTAGVGGFIGGGMNVGFNTSGQLFVQFQHSEMLGFGYFAGVGLQ